MTRFQAQSAPLAARKQPTLASRYTLKHVPPSSLSDLVQHQLDSSHRYHPCKEMTHATRDTHTLSYTTQACSDFGYIWRLYLGKRSQGLLQRAQACPGTQSKRQPQCTGQALQPLPAGAAPGTCTHKVHMNSQALVLADAVLKSLHAQQVSVSKSSDICMQRFN